MSWTYSCPYCDAMLNPDSTIVLVAEHGERKHLIGFHPEPGNYEIYLPPDVQVEQGVHWDFYCPVCHADLVNGELGDLAELRVRAGDREQRVFFSRIAGEHATLVLSERQVAEQHGPDAAKYTAQLMPVRF